MIDDSAIAALGGVSASPAPGASPAQARAYTHPALPGRTVVRLTPDDLAQVEDTALASLGFARTGDPAPIGHTRTRTTGFPEWPILSDPANARIAVSVVPGLRKAARTAAASPDRSVHWDLRGLASTLASSAPHFLPAFYEEAARIYVGLSDRVQALAYWKSAREAEEAHALPIDEDHRHQVFLEFSLAGIVSVAELSAECSRLLASRGAERALEDFFELTVERVRGGLPPYADLGADLRRLSEAAGADPIDTELRLLRQILPSPIMSKAPLAFWRAFSGALKALVEQDPGARRTLARTFPKSIQPDRWVAVLDSLGVTDYLLGGDADCRAWVEDYAEVIEEQRHNHFFSGRMVFSPALCRLVRRMPRLEGTTVALRNDSQIEPEFIDALADAGARVFFRPRYEQFADEPDPDLKLEPWAENPKRIDLTALARSEYVRLVEKSLLREGAARLDLFLSHAGTRAMLSAVAEPRLGPHPSPARIEAEARRLKPLFSPFSAPSFRPQFEALMGHLDEAALLADHLRDGLVTEYTWPALEEAIAELGPDVRFHESFPAVGVSSNGRVVWVDGGRRVAEAHPVPPQGTRVFHEDYVLVGSQTMCATSDSDGLVTIAWVDGPSATSSTKHYRIHSRQMETTTLPVPGGRLVGDRLIRPYDTTNPFPKRGPVLRDGDRYWCVRGGRLRGIDPGSGALADARLPDALMALIAPYLAEGWELRPDGVMWCPTTDTTRDSHCSTSGGRHVGVLLERHGTFLHVGASGEAVETRKPQGVWARMERPGGGHWLLTGTDRTQLLREADRMPLTDTADEVGGTHPFHSVPRTAWHHFRVRDEEASRRLRGATTEQVRALVEAVPLVEPSEPSWARTRAGALRDARKVLSKRARRAARELLGSQDPVLVDSVVWAAEAVKRIVAEARAALEEGRRALSDPRTQRTFPHWEASCDALAWMPGLATDLAYSSITTRRSVIAGLAKCLAGEQDRAGSGQDSLRVLLANPTAFLFCAARPGASESSVGASAAAFGDLVDCGLYSPTGCLFTAAQRPRDESDRVIGPHGRPAVRLGTMWADSGRTQVDVFYSPSGTVPKRLNGWPTRVLSRAPGVEGDRIVEAFKALLSDGAPPWDPEAARRLAEGTGWERPAAAVFLAGLPMPNRRKARRLDPELRELLGVTVKEAEAAMAFLASLGEDPLLRLAGAAAHDPVRFVREGADVDAVVEAWRREDDGSYRLPGGILAAAGRTGIPYGERALIALGSEPTSSSLDIWLWAAALAHRDDPLAGWLADAYEAMKRACAATPVVWKVSDFRCEFDNRWSQFCATLTAAESKAAANRHSSARGPWSIEPAEDGPLVTWDPRHVHDWRTERERALGLPWGVRYDLGWRLELLSGVYGAVAEDLRVVRPGAPKDPLSSAPHVVADVQKALGLPQDAARYWLQILALSDPTDANIHTWNTWTRKQRLKATEPLLEAGLLIEAKRARAGRTAFLPGGWQEATSPHKPMEVWKAPFYDLLNTPKVTPRHHTVTPLTTLTTLYEDAWHRYTTGDTPGYTELRTTPYRRPLPGGCAGSEDPQ